MESIKVIGNCSDHQRLLLAKTLKQINKTTCFTGDSIGDCFALKEADVSLTMSNYGTDYCMQICDLAIDRDAMIIYESLKFGRTIYENIRKFIQYQLTVAINLVLVIIIGTALYGEVPFQPCLILFINFIMDNMNSNIISLDLPEDGE